MLLSLRKFQGIRSSVSRTGVEDALEQKIYPAHLSLKKLQGFQELCAGKWGQKLNVYYNTTYNKVDHFTHNRVMDQHNNRVQELFSVIFIHIQSSRPN